MFTAAVRINTRALDLEEGQRLHKSLAPGGNTEVELKVGQDMRRVLVSTSSNMWE